MSDETLIQAFWSLAIFVGFVGALALGALVFESRVGRAAIRWAQRKRPRAAARWAEILGPDLKDYGRK
jgi:hypothetical protein